MDLNNTKKKTFTVDSDVALLKNRTNCFPGLDASY